MVVFLSVCLVDYKSFYYIYVHPLQWDLEKRKVFVLFWRKFPARSVERELQAICDVDCNFSQVINSSSFLPPCVVDVCETFGFFILFICRHNNVKTKCVANFSPPDSQRRIQSPGGFRVRVSPVYVKSTPISSLRMLWLFFSLYILLPSYAFFTLLLFRVSVFFFSSSSFASCHRPCERNWLPAPLAASVKTNNRIPGANSFPTTRQTDELLRIVQTLY